MFSQTGIIFSRPGPFRPQIKLSTGRVRHSRARGLESQPGDYVPPAGRSWGPRSPSRSPTPPACISNAQPDDRILCRGVLCRVAGSWATLLGVSGTRLDVWANMCLRVGGKGAVCRPLPTVVVCYFYSCFGGGRSILGGAGFFFKQTIAMK